MQQANKRNGKKWSIVETLKLQREYELLQLSVQEIALIHERSEKAILFKLEKEGWINNESTDSLNSENAALSSEESNDIRIYKLEYAMQEITRTIKDITSFFYSEKKSKPSSLAI
jgi:hypothetical protein